MVPCPWFREIADQPAADFDLGVHLTLTSEWPHYRWAPISTVSRASGLIDPDGYFWRTCLDLRAHVVPAAAEIEMRAQIERALQAGIDVTHLDTHMGAALVPELAEIYVRLGREYRLPRLLPRRFESYSCGWPSAIWRVRLRGSPRAGGLARYRRVPHDTGRAFRGR